VLTGFIWLTIGTVACPCEHGNGPSSSIKGREFVDYLSDRFGRRTLLHGVGLVRLVLFGLV
jgi:hypothetical protein